MNPPSYFHSRAFTILELLLAMVLLVMLVVMMSSIVSRTTSVWKSTQGKIEQFRQARDGFESMTKRISQSTLNTYWDYEDSSGKTRTPSTSSSFVPARYARQSELRFINGRGLTGVSHAIFFQAPLGVADDTAYKGLPTLLNTWGYYIELGDDAAFRPPFVTTASKTRFRLMVLMQPSEEMTLYKYTSGNSTYIGKEWFTDALSANPRRVHVLAENVIALILLPKLAPEEDPTGIALAPTYAYDSTVAKSDAAINSKNQLPPIVQVTMVAIDEVSANRMTSSDNEEFKTKLGGLFTNASKYTEDLDDLGTYLVSKHINYRVFTTNVSIKGAKWSREQTN